MINRLLILSALPLAIATSSILLPNKTIANQSEQIAENADRGTRRANRRDVSRF
jgi:hypothetical protein